MLGFLLFLQPDQSFCRKGGDYMLEWMPRVLLWTAIVCMQSRVLQKALWCGSSQGLLPARAWLLSKIQSFEGSACKNMCLSLISSFLTSTSRFFFFFGTTRSALMCPEMWVRLIIQQ